MIFAFFLLLFFGFFAVSIYFTIKYKNPYKLFMCFGKKGAGKTTYLTMLSIKYTKVGRPVYSTANVPYAKKLRVEDIGFKSFPPGSVLLIDEVGLIWNNRDFKGFKPEVRKYFKYQRHYKHTVYLFSQAFDIDKQLRDLTDRMFLFKNPLGWFSYIRSITRDIVVTEATSQADSRIADQLHMSGVLGLITGSSKIMLIPKYAKYFDSFILEDDLDRVDDEHWENEYREFVRKERLLLSKRKESSYRRVPFGRR